jgi:transcriptional regulator with XRE-family HTH domain
MTQADLAKAVSVSFQQIQKYEKGVNRVSASMLFNIAKALDVPVSYFFEINPLTSIPPNKRLAELVNHFEKMSDRKQEALLKIAREM